jgi:hypothetical protein
MADEQDRSEALDEDKIGGDFPPDRPMAVDRGDDSEVGTAGSDARDRDPLERGHDDDAAGDGDARGDIDPEVTLIDQTADADPGVAPLGTDELDEGESGDWMDGTPGEPDPDAGAFASELVPPPAEEDAMHVIPEP